MRIPRPFLLLLPFIIFGCARNEPVVVSQVPKEAICTLSRDRILDYPYSMEMITDSLFAVSTFNSISLYGTDGQYLGELGKQGRAAGEYSFPMKIRRDHGFLYVWSANTTSFMKFDKGGVYRGTYLYGKAISDFRVDNDIIYIYTAGGRQDSIIEVYDMSQGKVCASVGKVNDYHTLLSANISSAPLDIHGDTVFFCPKDRLKILGFSHDTCTYSRIIKSSTFRVDRSRQVSSVTSEKQERQKYLSKASNTAGLIVKGKDDYLLLTFEGTSNILDNGTLDTNNRIVTLYSSKSAPVHYRFSDFGSLATLSVYDDHFYFLGREAEGDDEYYVLYRLEL